MAKKLPPCSIEAAEAEVREIEETFLPSMDAAIRPLVLALRVWHVETVLSCEGHIEGYPNRDVPFVDFEKRSVDRVLELAGRWNRSPDSQFVWGVVQPMEPLGYDPLGWYRLQPGQHWHYEGSTSLSALQDDARAFAELALRFAQQELAELQ